MGLDELYLRLYGDPILRQRTREVTSFEGLDSLVERMFEIMYEEAGVGLAACQAGSTQRLMVLDVPEQEDSPGFRGVLINPEILAKEGTMRDEEGCLLSFPGIREDITRAARVSVRGQDIQGESIEFETGGLLSRALQHELDHLNGVLFIDHMSPIRRRLLAKKLKKIMEERSAGTA